MNGSHAQRSARLPALVLEVPRKVFQPGGRPALPAILFAFSLGCGSSTEPGSSGSFQFEITGDLNLVVSDQTGCHWFDDQFGTSEGISLTNPPEWTIWSLGLWTGPGEAAVGSHAIEPWGDEVPTGSWAAALTRTAYVVGPYGASYGRITGFWQASSGTISIASMTSSRTAGSFNFEAVQDSTRADPSPEGRPLDAPNISVSGTFDAERSYTVYCS